MNSIGPNSDPCGIPLHTGTHFEKVFYTDSLFPVKQESLDPASDILI